MAAKPRPASTRIVDDRIVINTAIAGLGPASGLTPICQRWAVLKNRAWLARSLRKTCGGGRRRGSAHPTYHKTSQIAVKRPTETIVQRSCGNHRRARAARRCQRSGAAAVRIFPLAPLAGRGTG
jgi:hypothetical protein